MYCIRRDCCGKRQTFESGGAGAVWVMGTKFWGWYLFCTGSGLTNCGTKTVVEQMNSAGVEKGNRLTLFDTRCWRVVGMLLAAKKQNGILVG